MKTDMCILLLVKYPEKGKVKVRLTWNFEEETVVELYRNFVLDTLLMLKSLGVTFIICFHPEGALQRFKEWLGTQYEYIPQRGSDLGERLHNSFMYIFSRNFQNAIIMASDCPGLPKEILLEAKEALKAHDVVIGPSPDGGYYLIGFKRTAFLPEAFKGITWSTNTVFDETVDKLMRAERNVYILPLWEDIDTFYDLKGLARKSSNINFIAPNTAKYILQLRKILNEGKR